MSGVDIAVVIVIGVLGLLIGSFLNVVIYRVPRGESIVSPPSACPRCGERIKWWDNIPVVSWLLLRARCRNCGEPISARYPLVELATGLLFAAVGVWLLAPGAGILFMSTPTLLSTILLTVAFLYLAAISMALALIDLDTHKLPNVIVLPSYIVAGVLLTAASFASGDFSALLRAGLAMVIMFVAYLAMAFAYPGGMGLGDVKLAGVLGLYLGYLGWGTLVVGSFAAFVLGGIFSLVLLALKRANRKSGIPFGPWMLGGAWVGIFLGESVWQGYLSLFGLTG